MQRSSADSLSSRVESLVRTFQANLGSLGPLNASRVHGSWQDSEDSLADVLRHQQVLVDLAEESGMRQRVGVSLPFLTQTVSYQVHCEGQRLSGSIAE